MGIEEFWNLIEKAKRKSGGDSNEQADILIEALSQYSAEDIVSFGTLFNELHNQSYQAKLWAAAHIILGGCSDDGFEYFRAWLIAKGRKVYEAALANPESLVKVKIEDAEDAECEAMLYVALIAYESKTDKTDFYDVVGNKGRPVMNIDWSEDSLKTLLPKLYKKFSAY